MSASLPPTSDRAAFIARVSRQLGRRSPTAPSEPPVVDEAIARVVDPREHWVEVFAARAVAAGMIVHRTQSREIDAAVIRLLSERNARRIAVADSPLLARLTPTASLELVAWKDGDGLQPLYSVDAGVTDVRAAIAETGSLVCRSGPGHGRGLSLVPPIHVALVRASDVLPDLVDLWRGIAASRISTEPLPSSIVLITGPSKTADIEGILITGVHGPREVHILLIEDL